MDYLIEFDDATLAQYTDFYFLLHPKAKKAPIKNPYHPSINEWMIMKRPAMNSLKQKWKDFIAWLVKAQGYDNLHIRQCDIEVTTFYKTNLSHDPDNSVPKFILDGLVHGGALENDDHRAIRSLTLKCSVDKSRPRTEIRIYECKENEYGKEKEC